MHPDLMGFVIEDVEEVVDGGILLSGQIRELEIGCRGGFVLVVEEGTTHQGWP
jgi:hypothetical protein